MPLMSVPAPLIDMPTQARSKPEETAWERGLRQARELMKKNLQKQEADESPNDSNASKGESTHENSSRRNATRIMSLSSRLSYNESDKKDVRSGGVTASSEAFTSPKNRGRQVLFFEQLPRPKTRKNDFSP